MVLRNKFKALAELNGDECGCRYNVAALKEQVLKLQGDNEKGVHQ